MGAIFTPGLGAVSYLETGSQENNIAAVSYLETSSTGPRNLPMTGFGT